MTHEAVFCLVKMYHNCVMVCFDPCHTWVRGVKRLILNGLERSRGSRVLDVGAGCFKVLGVYFGLGNRGELLPG